MEMFFPEYHNGKNTFFTKTEILSEEDLVIHSKKLIVQEILYGASLQSFFTGRVFV